MIRCTECWNAEIEHEPDDDPYWYCQEHDDWIIEDINKTPPWCPRKSDGGLCDPT
jgi:hypothetical protein